MLELKYVILEIKIHCEGLLAECRRQMKMSKNLMTYKQNREKKIKGKIELQRFVGQCQKV